MREGRREGKGLEEKRNEWREGEVGKRGRQLFTHICVYHTHTHTHTHHFKLSSGPEEKVELFRTSPISSLQKLKLSMVHMYENLNTRR